MDSFNYVKGFDLFGVKARQIPCLTAKGEPTVNLALKIGLLYINEDNGDMYKCIKGNGEESLVWVKIDNKSNDSGQNPPQDGEDGFSPLATVTQTADGVAISITDKNGTTTATVTNGKDGKDGKDGVDGKDGYTPQKGVDYFDGQPGKDGIDGKDGSPGADGYTPVKGKDYFDGEDGQDGSPGKDGADGNGIKSANLNADYTLTLTFDDGTTYTTPSIRGATGATGSAGKDGSAGAAGKDGSDGVGIASIKQTTTSTADGGNNVFTVTLTNGTSATFTVKNGSKGSTGAAGKDGSKGADGYTPVRGVDYYTEADKTEIVAMVIESLGGNPIFGTVDTNNNIVVSGNLPDGTYSVKYEMENGSTVNIGNLVLDTNVYYSVTNTLTNCTNSNSATKAVQGGSYSATIAAVSGYELKSVTVTMGGSPVTVSGGTISITNVTGNIVITAVAEEKAVAPSYKNLLPLAVNADGTPYEGGKGYKSGYKMSTSSGSESATTGAYCSGFMPITDIYSFIRVKNITLSDAANVNNFVFYDANKTKLTGSTANGTAGAFHVNAADEGNGVYKIRPSSFVSGSIAFFRFSCGGITDDTIVTVNEEITTPEIIEPTNLADPASSDWQEGYRLSIGSGDTSALAGHTTTNYIPAKMGDILRVKGLKIVGYLAGTTSDSPNAAKIVTFDASKTKLGGLYGTSSTGKNNYGNKVTQNGDISTYTIMMANDDSQQTTSNCAFIRIDGELMDGYTKNDVIITINEPIE